jgi:hypothetical protein
MSFITFQCYACGQMLKVGADKGGRKAKCHKCGTVLTIPVASAAPGTEAGAPPPGPTSSRSLPPPVPPAEAVPAAPPTAVTAGPTPVAPADEFADERPRPRRRRDEREYEEEEDLGPIRRPEGDPWARARLGLLLVFIGACVLAGAFLLEVVAELLLTINTIKEMSPSYRPTPGGGEGSATAFRVLLRIGLLLEMGAAITSLVGYVFCILGPRARGALGLAIAITAVAGVQLLLLIWKLILFFGSLFSPTGGPGPLQTGFFGFWFMLFLTQMLFAALFILFPFYLRSLSLQLKSRRNAAACTFVWILGCAYAGVRLLTYIFFYIVLDSLFTVVIVMFGPPREPPRAMIWITLVFLWLGIFAFGALLVLYVLRTWMTRALIVPGAGRVPARSSRSFDD